MASESTVFFPVTPSRPGGSLSVLILVALGILRGQLNGWTAHLTNMDERVVLSVEDSDADFYVIQMALKEAHIAIQVCRVYDGEQAIDFLERSGKFEGEPRPHLILLNVNMPRKNGFDVLAYLKAHDSFRFIPVVMFTTSADASERRKALALGADEYLTKPSKLQGLIDALGDVCSRFLENMHRRGDSGIA